MKKRILLLVSLVLSVNLIFAQTKKSVAVISMDTKELQYDSKTICNMVQLELEKTNHFEVLDKYDVSDLIKKNGIDVNASFGKNSLVKIGKMLNADKMITGSVEKFADKIIYILRLIDVSSESIEKTNVMEYVNQQDQMQIMTRISINNLLDIPNDKVLVDLLANYDQPITSAKTTLKLNGPRVGAYYGWGKASDRLTSTKKYGGFDMFPVNCMIGYQFEKQYLSSGDFQALIEFIPALNGLESGYISPSLTTMLGFRFNKSGFEFGLGPTFRVVKTAYGYYDANNIWHLQSEDPLQTQFEILEELDNRGDPSISSNMVFAIGKTIKSGYLNMPINVYLAPRKYGSIVGFTIGFNVAKRPKFTEKKSSNN